MTGFRRLEASDPEEQRLRSLCHTHQDDENWHELAATRDLLAAYIWKRACDEVAADRAKHSKKKRNQIYNGPMGEGRSLP